MRKGLMLLIVSLITCMFGSCKYYDPMYESGQDDNVYDNEYNNEIYNKIGNERWIWDDSVGDECALKVIDCFINKDSETLKEMFCSRAKIDPDFDKQIDEAFEYINGNIISYDDYIPSASSANYDEGKLVERFYSPRIKNIKTDAKRTYKIVINLYTVYDKDEERVGINSLTVRENSEDSVYRLGLPPP